VISPAVVQVAPVLALLTVTQLVALQYLSVPAEYTSSPSLPVGVVHAAKADSEPATTSSAMQTNQPLSVGYIKHPTFLPSARFQKL
jgi:hypothetical protein